MALVLQQLALVRNNGVGPRFWSYNTDDSPGVVKGAGYFNNAQFHLRAGDFLFCECGDGSLTTQTFMACVVSVIAGVVVIASKTVDL